MGFNPNTPNTIGVEWDAAAESVTTLTTANDVAAIRITSTATETIDKIYVPHTWVGPSTGYGKLQCDIYDLSDAGAGQAKTTTRYQPNETVANNNQFLIVQSPFSWSNITTASWDEVNDVAAPSAPARYLGFSTTSSARFCFNSSAFTGQVSSVSFEIRAFGYHGCVPRADVQLYNNTTFVSTLGTLAPPATGDDIGNSWPTWATYTIGPFTVNPNTGVAWTADNIAKFDTNGAGGYNLGISWSSGIVSVCWISMVVESGTDKRVATGSTATQTSLPSGVQHNLPITLATNWSKATGKDYLLCLRRIDDPTGRAQTLIPQPIWLGTATCPHPNGFAQSATLDSGGMLATTGSPDYTKTYPVVLNINGGTTASVDSQPYWDLVPKTVYTGAPVKQGVLGTVNTYKGVRALVAYSASYAPTADLTFKVYLTAGDVLKGGTATVTKAYHDTLTTTGTITDATWGNLKFKLVDVDLGTATGNLTAAAHYFKIESSTSSTNPWFVLMLDATGQQSTTNLTYGDSTYKANVNGSDFAQGDIVVRISTTPVTPASITVTNVTTTINGVSIDYAKVEWTDGGGAGFLRWEVERSEDTGTTWTQIATVSTQATLRFDDYEGKRGNANKYRVRVIRTDGARSDYVTQSGTVTPSLMTGSKLAFTTNASSSLTCAYAIQSTSTTYDFLTSNEFTYMKLHNRDYTAAFKPLEQRGITWQFTLQVHASRTAPTAGSGVQAFGTLRSIAETSTVPYVCLHTSDGERFFGVLEVGKGDRHGTAGIYKASCKFVQTQSTSTSVAVP